MRTAYPQIRCASTVTIAAPTVPIRGGLIPQHASGSATPTPRTSQPPQPRLSRPLAAVAIRQEGRKIWHVAFPRSKFAFLTLPRYSMIALSTAVEPLRMANKLIGQSVYDWSIVSLDGQPTPASNGLQLAPTVPLEQLGPVDILFVCGGGGGEEAGLGKIPGGLRGAGGRRVPLGGAGA